MVVEVVVEFADDFYLFLDYFGEDSIFDCEESCHAHVVFFLDFGLNAHPEGDAGHYLQDDASQTPYIYCPRVFVLLHLA